MHLQERGAKDPGEGHEVCCDECFMWWLERLDEPPQVKPRLRKLFEEHTPV